MLSGYDFTEISLWSLVWEKKTKFLWPTSEHKGRMLENAILFLDGHGDISEKLVHESISATFLL